MFTRTSFLFLSVAAVAWAAVGDACVQKVDCGVQEYEQCCRYAAGNHSACIDTRYQQCCPNTHCYAYASCCNDTCCSGRSSCFAADTLEGSRDTCSEIETMSPAQSYVTIFFPMILAITSLIFFVFACMMLYLYKVRFTFPAVAVSAIAVLVFLLSFCLLLSPHSLQALFICAVAALALASLAATSDPLAPTHVLVVSIVASVIAFLLLINPLASNSVLSFSPQYPSIASNLANSEHGQGGVVGSFLASLSPQALEAANSHASAPGFASCPAYYLGYWRRDPQLYNDVRVHDPAVYREPYGLCGRSFLLWNAICATVLAGLVPLLVLTLVARLLEVRGVTAVFPSGILATKVHPRARHETATTTAGSPMRPRVEEVRENDFEVTQGAG